jgi:hypothetical protein
MLPVSEANSDDLSGVEYETPPIPSQLLELALVRLESDVSVSIFSDAEGVLHEWSAQPPIAPDSMPADVFANALLQVARALYGIMSDIQLRNKISDQDVQLLCLALSRYRRRPEFLRLAASLVSVTEEGELLYPQLPSGSCWEWVR